MENVNENASLDFKWLKKRDDKIDEVQFYESFIYDGVKYMVYDCVFLGNGDLREPYIGKLTKMWELPNKTKEVKVHWFFRPKEISQWLGDTETLENEILFASGEGLGLANVNPLEAIVGRCNVVCISEDNRNPQPSDEQLKAADFVFYRVLDVQSCDISDKMDDKIGELEIKYVFNREESKETNPFLESASDTKQKDDAKGEPQNKGIPSLLERNTSFKKFDKSHDRPFKIHKSDDKCVEPVVAQGFEKMTDMPSMKSMVDKADKGEMKVGIVPVQKVENKERNKNPTGSDEFYDRPWKKMKSDDKKPPKEKHVEFEAAHYLKKSTVDRESKNKDKLPAGVNNLKSSGARGTTEDRKNHIGSAKVPSGDLEGKNLKRARDADSNNVPDNRMGTNTDMRDLIAKGKSKSGTALDILGNNKNNNYDKEGKVEQSGSKKELSMNKLLEVPALATDINKKNAYREFVITPKETSNWFKRLPWGEDKLKNAYNQGTVILLHNMDPDYNSGEVEDIICHAFKEKCEARILQHTSVSSPHYVQALILLKTKKAAQKVLKMLDEECLILSNGMPLVATPCPPISTKENSNFFGHLAINRARFQNQREAEAVSTSHFSQPNTIEFHLAMEWCLQQSLSMKCWEKLHKQQGAELEKLKSNLKKNCA